MQMISSVFLMGLVLFIGLYFYGVIYLSKKRKLYLGLILPSIFACFAMYNLIKPMVVYNPFPTMKEGIYMTFFGALSLIGYFILIIIKLFQKKYRWNDKEQGGV